MKGEDAPRNNFGQDVLCNYVECRGQHGSARKMAISHLRNKEPRSLCWIILTNDRICRVRGLADAFPSDYANAVLGYEIGRSFKEDVYVISNPMGIKQ